MACSLLACVIWPVVSLLACVIWPVKRKCTRMNSNLRKRVGVYPFSVELRVFFNHELFQNTEKSLGIRVVDVTAFLEGGGIQKRLHNG